MEPAIGPHSMFDAARPALLASSAPVEAEIARTHGGLIAAFSLHLVKTGRVPVELGRALNKVAELRLVGDYKGDPLAKGETIVDSEPQCQFRGAVGDVSCL